MKLTKLPLIHCYDENGLVLRNLKSVEIFIFRWSKGMVPLANLSVFYFSATDNLVRQVLKNKPELEPLLKTFSHHLSAIYITDHRDIDSVRRPALPNVAKRVSFVTAQGRRTLTFASPIACITL